MCDGPTLAAVPTHERPTTKRTCVRTRSRSPSAFVKTALRASTSRSAARIAGSLSRTGVISAAAAGPDLFVVCRSISEHRQTLVMPPQPPPKSRAVHSVPGATSIAKAKRSDLNTFQRGRGHEHDHDCHESRPHGSLPVGPEYAQT